MSDETESLARQILQMTNDGRLVWKLVPNPTATELRADIGDEQYITVKRTSQGDDKEVELALSNASGPILQGSANNYISSSSRNILSSLASSVAQSAISDLFSSVNPDLNRFSLFSDVFLAARRSATGEDSALAKFKSSLGKVGMS
jgi:hypothetical protein